MRPFLICLLLGFFQSALAGNSSPARPEPPLVVSGRVIKLLPLFLDQDGRDSTSPSLFNRDAYQLELQEHLKLVYGLRLDVQWKALKLPDEKLIIRVEARGVSQDGSPTVKTFEAPVVASSFSHWNEFTLNGAEFKSFGSLVAWRATLWNDKTLLGEQKSFLW